MPFVRRDAIFHDRGRFAGCWGKSGEWAWLRSMHADKGTGGLDSADKDYAAHCLCMRCLARDIRRATADNFGPEMLGQIKCGHRDGAPEGSDIVIRTLLADVYAISISPKKSEGSLRHIYLFEARGSGITSC